MFVLCVCVLDVECVGFVMSCVCVFFVVLGGRVQKAVVLCVVGCHHSPCENRRAFMSACVASEMTRRRGVCQSTHTTYFCYIMNGVMTECTWSKGLIFRTIRSMQPMG